MLVGKLVFVLCKYQIKNYGDVRYQFISLVVNEAIEE